MTQPPLFPWKKSILFDDRYVCRLCGLPVRVEQMAPRGLCMECDDKVKRNATALSVIMEDPVEAPKTFNEVLKLLRKSGSPATIGVAESILQESGGQDQIGKQIWQDLRKIRGEDLEPWQRELHVTDFKTLKGMYDLITKILSQRDEMILSTKDPLEELDEQELMTLTAEAAKIRITSDKEFRDELLAMIDDIDPSALEQRYLSRFGIPAIVS